VKALRYIQLCGLRWNVLNVVLHIYLVPGMNECVENITKVEWEHLVKHVAMLFRAGNDVRLAFREDDPPGTICMVDEVDYRIQYINHKGNPYLVDHETFCFQREINGPCTFKQVCNCFHIYITIKQPIEMIDFQAVIV